jgi:NACalpha-BTF3-like transcription factor
MWAGERREGAVVGTSDSNSAHIVRKLLSMFQTLEGGSSVTHSDASYPSDVSPYSSVGSTRSSVSEGDVQTVMLVTGCDPEQARNCLEAAGGDADEAINIFFGS